MGIELMSSAVSCDSPSDIGELSLLLQPTEKNAMIMAITMILVRTDPPITISKLFQEVRDNIPDSNITRKC